MIASRAVSVVCLIVFAAGCGQPASPNASAPAGAPTAVPVLLPPENFKVVDKNGATGLEFGQWVLVFEGIPYSSPAGSSGAIFVPSPDVSTSNVAIFGNLTIAQSCDGKHNSITVGSVAFKLSDGGNKLEFADQTYQVTNAKKTIVIGKDGKSHEDAGK